MVLPQNRQKLANFKWLIESHLEPEGLVEEDYFHTFNQNLIKMYKNTKKFILTTWFFPHSLPFGFFHSFFVEEDIFSFCYTVSGTTDQFSLEFLGFAKVEV